MMSECCSFRQVEEKHVSAKVHLLVWSPKMDLLALTNVQGEVVLHRLSWQKVWTLKPHSENIHVSSLAWRPDGKVLAVSYTDGKVALCDVENSRSLHTLNFDEPITCLRWISELTQVTSEPETEIFTEKSSEYLPRLHPLTKSYGGTSKSNSEENFEDSKKLKDQKDLNVLLVGTQFGVVHLFVYGILGVGTVHLNQHGDGLAGSVTSASLSDDLRILSVYVESPHDASNDVTSHVMTFDTTLLASRRSELKVLAHKFGLVQTLVSYMQRVVKQMTEAWEDILLETDSKLLKFAEEKYKLCSGSVSTDFLELLMFGTPSDELKMFLLHELTNKGLKKLGHSLDTSYSNIQQLVLKHLQVVAQSIFYHLNDLQAMSCWFERFGVLGLQTQLVEDARSAAGSLILKASELQLVIDRSMKNFKAFFRWLYVEIQKLSEEPIPAELSKMTQQDVSFVAEFLKDNFTEEMDGTKSGFKLEKVGQYLKDADLTVLPSNKNDMWSKHVVPSGLLDGCKLFYKAEVNKSLTQVQKSLESSIESTMLKPSSVIGDSLQCLGTWKICVHPEFERLDVKTPILVTKQHTCVVVDRTYLYSLSVDCVPPCDKLLVTRQLTDRSCVCPEISCFKFGKVPSSGEEDSGCGQCKILDFSFYNDSTLTVLLMEDTEDGQSLLVQVPLHSVPTEVYQPLDSSTVLVQWNYVDVSPYIEQQNIHRLDNMKGQSLAVSGSRKVACVVASSRRRVRLFLTEVEDDEDDDDHNESSIVRDDSKQCFDDSSAMSANDEDKENTSVCE